MLRGRLKLVYLANTNSNFKWPCKAINNGCAQRSSQPQVVFCLKEELVEFKIETVLKEGNKIALNRLKIHPFSNQNIHKKPPFKPFKLISSYWVGSSIVL